MQCHGERNSVLTQSRSVIMCLLADWLVPSQHSVGLSSISRPTLSPSEKSACYEGQLLSIARRSATNAVAQTQKLFALPGRAFMSLAVACIW